MASLAWKGLSKKKKNNMLCGQKSLINLLEINAFLNQFVNLMAGNSSLLGNKTVLFGWLYTKGIFSK
jgi:hypothetical protein